jgi:hypothetical protein
MDATPAGGWVRIDRIAEGAVAERMDGVTPLEWDAAATVVFK